MRRVRISIRHAEVSIKKIPGWALEGFGAFRCLNLEVRGADDARVYQRDAVRNAILAYPQPGNRGIFTENRDGCCAVKHPQSAVHVGRSCFLISGI